MVQNHELSEQLNKINEKSPESHDKERNIQNLTTPKFVNGTNKKVIFPDETQDTK